MTVQSYKELQVWQKAKKLALITYSITDTFPKEEVYGLRSQIRRSAVSIPSNIAEGRYRGSKQDYKKFLWVAYGSAAELDTQLEIARDLGLITDSQYNECAETLIEVLKMLNVMQQKL